MQTTKANFKTKYCIIGDLQRPKLGYKNVKLWELHPEVIKRWTQNIEIVIR